MAFVGGFALMYMMYDVLHYLFHHGPEWAVKIRYVQLMKTRHMMHHYSNPNLNFGVTSPLFDLVFGTNDNAKL
jgi:4-hydroxysphinganine ceramide fatty acyl 2-hydroxylase